MMSINPKAKDKRLMMMKRKSTLRKNFKIVLRNINKIRIFQINLQDYVLLIVECVEDTVSNNVVVIYHKIAIYFEKK
jgi:hypothetical protein